MVPSSQFAVNIVGRPLFINVSISTDVFHLSFNLNKYYMTQLNHQKDKKTVTGYRGLDTKVEQSFCSDPPPDQVYWIYGSNRIPVK